MCIEPENEAVKQSIDEIALLKRELADANEARHFNASQCVKMHEEITMLRKQLEAANEQAERFERGWYLRGDALESIKEHCEPQPSVLASAIVSTCNLGRTTRNSKMDHTELRIGDKVQCGVYVCGKWTPTNTGIITAQSFDRSVSDVDIMSLHGGAPRVIKEATSHLRPNAEISGGGTPSAGLSG